MESFKIIVVSPFSPRYSSIASIRWELLCKYLSKKYNVSLITSKFLDKRIERSFSLGNTELVEVPIKWSLKNIYSYSRESFERREKNENIISLVLKFIKFFIPSKIRSEFYFLLERIFPITPEGIAYQNIKLYKSEIEKRLSKQGKNILITSYGPWFTLKLGKYFKNKYKDIIWIADFRDPSFNSVHHEVSKAFFFKFQTKNILKKVDLITVVSKKMKEDYESITPKKVYFLPNGYDGELFSIEKLKSKITKSRGFLTICYTGSLNAKTQNISYFIDALEMACRIDTNINFAFNYAGFQFDLVEKEFSKRNLGSLLNNHGMLTRDEALNLQSVSDVLLLVVYTGENPEEGKSIRTGKVYEYLATDKPILVIGPKNWEMRDEIECDGVSKVFEKNQTNEMADYIIELANKEKIEINIQKRKEVLERYLYRNLATELEKEIENLLKQKEW
ncbi:glycosyltransferase family 4 protein [Fervidobacterium sp. 2310opik-2]|uniref:glycosyltransferase family 4 protein n=1 Tax=Fervidobacterium sp. 2310opik-2 TaxID=1755815 RepID=UPI0013DF02E4|nr:glycosyltransferase family 4 protein [Fervidobacterium sp. 2310opik-2]KAF2960924.1 hypothetical protein AS161_03630 [Fervidobacterium sp. 2310opik-2]